MNSNTLRNIMRIILGIFMVLAGIGHLTFQRIEFQAQVPMWLPQHPLFIDFIVLASGAMEIAFGLCLIFIKKYRPQIGLTLALFFIIIFPGNISQYMNGIDAFGLDTDQKRLFRLFFQPVLIIWSIWSANTFNYYYNKKRK